MSRSPEAEGKLGREIRVALYVVAVLALLFCGLLYARIYGRGLTLPDASITVDPLPTQGNIAPAHFPRPSQPTIVRGGNWEELTQPAITIGENTTDRSPEPDSISQRAARARRIPTAAEEYRPADPTLVNPRQAGSSESSSPALHDSFAP